MKHTTVDAAEFKALAAKQSRKRGPSKANALNAACLLVCKLHGIKAWKNETQGQWDAAKQVYRKFHGLKGVSDILGITCGGRFVAIETKTAHDRLRTEQRDFLADVERRGGI